MIPYIGDISKADAGILKQLAGPAKNILEFGCGASTQILTKYSDGSFTTVETDPDWIVRTKENMKLLGITKEPVFADYYTFLPEGEYDLIFDDGAVEFRLPFALLAWDHLKIGGYLLIHDTRTSREVQVVHDFMKEKSPEIESIYINKDHSNITVIKKKKAEFYEDWNVIEGREPWESGYEPVDIEKLDQKVQSLLKNFHEKVEVSRQDKPNSLKDGQ